MTLKYSIALFLMCLSFSSQSSVTEKIISTQHGLWEQGSTKCSDWSPDVSKSPANLMFAQSRSCSTQMTRKSKTIYSTAAVSKEERQNKIKENIETRIDSSVQRRNVRGGMDSIVGLRQRKNFSDWRPVSIKSCSPQPSLQDKIGKGTLFFVIKNCVADMEREKETVEVWLSGKQTPRKDLSILEKKQGIYTHIISSTGLMESWINDGVREGEFVLSQSSCESIYVKPSWELGKIVEFPVSCTNIYTQKIENLQVSSSGKRRVSQTQVKDKKLKTTLFTGIAGQEDFVLKTQEVHSDWEVKPGEQQECFGQRQLDPALLHWGDLFTEVFQCSLPHMRKRESVRTYASGHVDRQLIELEFKDIFVTQTKTTMGGRDEKISEGARYYSEWTPFSELSCTPWEPRETIIPQGLEFIQTQECSQSRDRDLFVDEIWKTGSRQTHIGKESDLKRSMSTRSSKGVAAISFDSVSVTFQGDATPAQKISIHPMAKRVKVELVSESSVSEPILIHINKIQLEIPPVKRERAVYYYGIEEYQIQYGDNTVTFTGGNNTKGIIRVVVE